MVRPAAPDNVVPDTEAQSSWANELVDAVNEVLDDIYGAAVGSALAIPWANLTGVPSTFTPAAHTLASHTSATPAAIGAWAKLSAGGGAAGVTIHVGTTPPASPAEGDVWIKG